MFPGEPGSLTPGQRELLEAQEREIVFFGPMGSGQTFGLLRWLFDGAQRFQASSAVYAAGGRTQELSAGHGFDHAVRTARYFAHWSFRLSDRQAMREQSRVLFRTLDEMASDAEVSRGLRPMRIAVDGLTIEDLAMYDALKHRFPNARFVVCPTFDFATPKARRIAAAPMIGTQYLQ